MPRKALKRSTKVFAKGRRSNSRTNQSFKWKKFAVLLSIGVLVVISFRIFRVPSRSMENTLHNGDYLLIEQVSSIANDIPFLSSTVSRPEIGDLLLFSMLEDPSRIYVKRCIATEGQVVEIVDKIVFVDGIRIYDPPYSKYIDAKIFPAKESVRDNFGPYEVPEKMVFVMGDNRDNSRDSRHWGSVPMRMVLGKPLFICTSVESTVNGPVTLWHAIRSLPDRIRWSRTAMRIH